MLYMSNVLQMLRVVVLDPTFRTLLGMDVSQLPSGSCPSSETTVTNAAMSNREIIDLSEFYTDNKIKAKT